MKSSVTLTEIKNSAKILFDNKEHNDLINSFARSEYAKKFPTPSDLNQNGRFHYYTGFNMIAPDMISVNYAYGAGEFEFTDSFLVEL